MTVVDGWPIMQVLRRAIGNYFSTWDVQRVIARRVTHWSISPSIERASRGLDP